MKRVLLVSYIFPPMVAGGAPRIGQFAKYLPQFGWLPTVLTVPMHPRAVDDHALAELSPETQVVRAFCPFDRLAGRGGSNPRRGWAGIKRRLVRTAMNLACIPDRQVFWYPWAVKAGRALLRQHKFDAIMATYGPGTNLMIGRRLSRISGVPLVADYRDLWTSNPLVKYSTPVHGWICRRIERRSVRQAARIIAVSPDMAEHLAELHGRVPGDMACISNGFDPDDLVRIHDTPRAGAKPYRICYTGSVYGRCNFDPFFQAIKRLQQAGEITPTDFQVEFVGNLDPSEPAGWGVSEFVQSRPAVAHHQVFDVLAESDAHLVFEPPGYCAKYSYAAKIFDYMLTGKPVLALVEPGGYSARLLASAGVGEVAHPLDSQQIERGLRALLSRRTAPPHKVDISEAPWCDFDRRNLTRRLADVLNAAATGQSAATTNLETPLVAR